MLTNTLYFITLLLTVLTVSVSAVKSNFKQKYERNIIQKVNLNIINSETKPGNLLPNFLFMAGSIEGGSVGVNIGGGRGVPHKFQPDDSCGDDIFEGAMEDMRSPQLPYLTQDLWGCEREKKDIEVFTIETEDLKVTITPQYAGKVWGIYDKKRGKEVLYANKAHQPANIGALKSWAAGGAEWNWSPGIIGHSAFSETEVHLAQVETERGPMLRVYEFDRYNGTVWQVDMIIGDGSFLAHPRITNPTNVDLRGYWWTCVAVESTPDTRIITPATHQAQTSRDPMRYAGWPVYAEALENASFTGYKNAWPTDNSYLGNHQIGDMFFRIPEEVYTPYIGHTNEDLDGYILIHGHPLNGTKFFTWGQSGPGRFMQDFLAAGDKGSGYYTELQVGPAPTQMQNFPVPKNSIREWTEWFKGFDGSKEKLMSTNYDDALNEVDTLMKQTNGKGMPQENVKDWDAFFEKYATVTPSEILVDGQPWGYLEEQLLGTKLAPGLTFEAPRAGTDAFYEAKPWIDLINTGKFSEDTLARLPLSYQTTDRWYDLLIKSATEGEMTWLHALHIGVGSAERGNMDEPKALFKKSNELRLNPIATRCLAVLSSTEDDAWPLFKQAWEISQTAEWKADPAYFRVTDNLVNEISFFLQQYGDYSLMEQFVAAVPVGHRLLDSFITLEIKVELHNKNYNGAKELLSANCFPTYAKARIDLMSMWNSAVEGIASVTKGTALTNVEKHQARMNDMVPDNIGCQYASEYCLNYW